MSFFVQNLSLRFLTAGRIPNKSECIRGAFREKMMAQLANRISFKVIFHYTKEFITKTTLTVIPACLESFFKKDAGQASMTEH